MGDNSPTDIDRQASWQAPERPAWLAALNREGEHLDLSTVVPLDTDNLIDTAKRKTGLSDFGEDHWRAPFETLCRDISGPAELTLMGRLMMRSDLLIWLENRLRIAELLKQHPEIHDEKIENPVFIVGLPRSGTSILFEVLSRDPACGVPETWEALFPCPPPTAEGYATDPRIEQAHELVTQWNRVVPEFATMHEMGGRIPAECGLIMANSFISDHVASLSQAHEYGGLYATADMRPAYRDHETILKILQWKNPRGYWLLKAPAHQNHLDILLETYPDARIIQTHRDPIKCMASTTSLMGCLYYMRSDLPFDSDAFEDIMKGEATSARLEHVMSQRESGVIPEARICDSRFQDLMDDPLACVEKIYAHFDWKLSDEARTRMTQYLANKPKDKFGAHKYQVGVEELEERKLFRAYQDKYGVPDEV
ncbi:MAG: sulfotransferase [Myxococcota bacterium]|jgi:hypothetical protein|nr:sulfotransferase [Myxococcota bacterium]